MANSAAVARRPRHILTLSAQEKRAFLDSFERVFSDVDGVVWNLSEKIEGAPAGFEALTSAGKQVVFLSNNSVRTKDNYAEKFNKLNMNVDMDNVITPALSVVKYLKRLQFDGLIYIMACENFKRELTGAGFKLIDGPTKILNESFSEMFQHAFDTRPVRAVVIDFDFNLSAVNLMKAHAFLNHPDCLLIGGATDMLLPLNTDVSVLGPGPFGKVLAESSNKRMITLGKPGDDLAELLLQQYKISDARRCLMIGDMLMQDIGFGRKCGFQTLVVLSGGCSLEQLHAQTNPQLTPDYYADSMADFRQFMQDLNKAHC